MKKYKDYRIIDCRPRWVIVENEKIINKNPTKEELVHLEQELCEWRYSDRELLEYLIKFYEENRKSPKAIDSDCSLKYPSHMTYLRRFGSWNNALKMAGLQIHNLRITDNDLLKYLTNFWEEKRRPPVWYDFKNNSKYPDPETYQYHSMLIQWLEKVL